MRSSSWSRPAKPRATSVTPCTERAGPDSTPPWCVFICWLCRPTGRLYFLDIDTSENRLSRFSLLFRCLDSSTLCSGLETSGSSSRRPVGTKVPPGLQAGLTRSRPAPSTRAALSSQVATALRGAWTRPLITARWAGPPPTPIRCSCRSSSALIQHQGEDEGRNSSSSLICAIYPRCWNMSIVGNVWLSIVVYSSCQCVVHWKSCFL